jgi:hypothetical protein
MNTIAIVWILVSVGGYGTTQVVYSPSMQTEEACQSLKRAINHTTGAGNPVRSTCVQLPAVVSK